MLIWNVWSIANEEKLTNFLQIIEDKDINMACNRTIKYHKFYSPGDNIDFEDLGIPTTKNVQGSLKILQEAV